MSRPAVIERARRRALVGAVTLLVGILVASCSETIKNVSATAVVVSVYSKDIDLANVRVSVLDAALAKMGGTANFPIGPDSGKFPLSFTVVPRAGATGGSFVVRVEGIDEDEVTRVSVQARATFLAGKTRLLTLWLAKICEDVVCAEHQTCHYEDDDSLAGECGDLLIPRLTDYARGADEDLGQFPSLATPDLLLDGGPVDTVDAEVVVDPADAGEPPPVVPNLPTIGNFRSLGAHRANGDGTMLLYDDGFEESGRVCNPDGLCAVAGFVP